MKIELLRKWGGKPKGTALTLEDDKAQNLIKRKFAKVAEPEPEKKPAKKKTAAPKAKQEKPNG